MKRNISLSLYYSLFLSLLYGSVFVLYYVILKPDKVISILYGLLYSYAHGFELAIFVLVLSMLFMWLPKYVKSFFYVLLGFIFLLYIIIDISVYKQFRYNISFSMLQLFLGPASKEIFNFSVGMYIQFILIVLLLLFIIIGLYIMAYKFANKGKIKQPVIIISVLLTMVISYHSIHAYAHFKNYLPIMQVAYVLPQSYPLILDDLLRTYGIESKHRKFESVSISNIHYPLSFPKVGDNATKFNVLFIVIESWRSDSMTQDITPNIYKFATNNVTFKHHIANANATRYGLFSLFYGIPGNYWDAALYSATSPVLMDMFQQQNYQLGIFASASLLSPEFNRTIFSKVDNLRVSTNAPTANLRDVKITDEFLDFLRNKKDEQPFFGFLFYDTPHSYSFDEKVYPAKFTPYQKRRNYINTSGDERELLLNLYKNTLGYTDVLVGRVLDELYKQNLLDNTVVVITGDHGEEFNDLNDNYWGHFGNYSKYQTEVPMIISIPNIEHKTVDYETSHMDVVPTIMKYVFDTPTPTEDYSIGYDLLDNITRPFIFIKGEEYAVKYQNRYIIMKRYGLPEVRDENYNIINETINGQIVQQVFYLLKKYRN